MSTICHVTIDSDIEDDQDHRKDMLCEYPPNIEGRVPICIDDFKSLEEETFLNDQIISMPT